MTGIHVKDRLRGSLYAGFLGILFAAPCIGLAIEVCCHWVPCQSYPSDFSLRDFFRSGFRNPDLIVWRLLNGVATAVIYFVVPSTGAQDQKPVPLHTLSRAILDSLKLAGPYLLLPLVCLQPRSPLDIISLIPMCLIFISPTLFLMALMRLLIMRARRNPARLRNYFLGILAFVPLMWMGAGLAESGDGDGQVFTALFTGPGLTAFMAAGLVDLIRAWDASS
jgi:hypothetical protein